MAATLTTPFVDYAGSLVLGQGSWQPMQVLLFTNFTSLSPATILANLVECTAPGYSRFVINPGGWTSTLPANPALFQYPTLTWVFDGPGAPPQVIFGYAVLLSNVVVAWAENFPAPFPIPPEGGELPLTLFFSDKQCG